jgi:hypothetical protein
MQIGTSSQYARHHSICIHTRPRGLIILMRFLSGWAQAWKILGCIFPAFAESHSGLPDVSFLIFQNGGKYTKFPLNNQMAVKYTYLMTIGYTNFFNSKRFKIYPNWNFWFENRPSGNPGLIIFTQFRSIYRRKGLVIKYPRRRVISAKKGK